jgi:hypothetical protein
MTLIHAGATLAATLLFVFAFVRERPLRLRERLDPRTFVSIAGGAAVAYVFVGLSPELQSAGVAFRESTSHLGLRFLRYGVNVATMLGFLFFYGVDQLVMRELEVEAPSRDAGAGRALRLFSVHIGSFAAYTWVVSYLMVSSEHHVTARFVFYALAMAFHFVSVASTLRDEHGSLYARKGAWTCRSEPRRLGVRACVRVARSRHRLPARPGCGGRHGQHGDLRTSATAARQTGPVRARGRGLCILPVAGLSEPRRRVRVVPSRPLVDTPLARNAPRVCSVP